MASRYNWGIVSNATQTGNEKMKITTEQLNAVATLLNTTDKNLVISYVIGTLVNEGGMSVKEAYEAVWGEGSYDQMAGMVYDMLKAA